MSTTPLSRSDNFDLHAHETELCANLNLYPKTAFLMHERVRKCHFSIVTVVDELNRDLPKFRWGVEVITYH
jgi:hypothetical protein